MRNFLTEYKNNFIGFILVVLGVGLFIGVLIYLMPHRTHRGEVEKTLYETLNTSISYTFIFLSGIVVVIYGFNVMGENKATLQFNKDLVEALTPKLPKLKYKRKSKVDMDYVNKELQKIVDNE